MNPQKTDIALLVHSCDRYEFLFKGFDIFFSKYWDFDIHSNCYFATEEKNAVVDGFTTIQSGKGEWSDRLAYLLNEKIKEKYILYFQEDMWLTQKVNAKFFNTLFQAALKNNWQQVKLHSSEVYKTTATVLFIEGFNVAKLDNTASGYLMSHQVTLWDREFLLRQLLKNEHPWRNEKRGTKRLRKLAPAIYHIDYFAENGKPAINNNQNPVGRSEYNSISINGILGGSIEPYINELMQGNKEQKEYAGQLMHHYQHQLTHDGKPKPRKEDLFQKIKRKWREK